MIVQYWCDYRDIICSLKNKFFLLSLEKYSSNVVEKIIEKDKYFLSEFIKEIIESHKISEVMKSNFGNYVIQKAIKLAKSSEKNKLVYNAAKYIHLLNDHKLIQKWKHILFPHMNNLSREQISKLNSKKFFDV